jgi:HK97 family phage portal protein
MKIKIKIPFTNKYIHINNSNLANPQEWLLKMLGGGKKSASGIEVNAKESLRVSVVFACVKIIAETVAYLNCNIYKRTLKGKFKDSNHNLYNILHNLPNKETIAFDFWVMYIVNLLLTGDAFAYIKRDGNGKIKELWNIPSKNVRIYRNEVTDELFYEIKEIAKQGEKDPIYYPENMMHTRGMRYDNKDESLDPIRLARNALGLGLALEEYASKYFANGAQTGGMVEYPIAMSDIAFKRFKDDFHKNYQGVINSNKVMFLEDGAKYTKITNNPDESQAIESRQFQVIEICRFFNVPPHKVFDLTRATFSNIEEQNIDFVTSCISPMCLRLEQGIFKDLLSKTERVSYFAKFNTNALLRGNTEARRNFYNTMIQNGVMSPNDVRELEDMNSYDGGNIYMVNGNMIPVSQVGTQYDKGADDNNDKD